MLISGLVYTFLALVASGAAIASVIYGVYLLTSAGVTAYNGGLESAALTFLHAEGMGLAAFASVALAHWFAQRGLDLFNSDDDEEEDEYLYIDDGDDDE